MAEVILQHRYSKSNASFHKMLVKKYYLWGRHKCLPFDYEPFLYVTEMLGHDRESTSLRVTGWGCDPLNETVVDHTEDT